MNNAIHQYEIEYPIYDPFTGYHWVTEMRGGDGSGILCRSSFAKISNCIISENSADLGDGIRGDYASQLIIECCIIYKNLKVGVNCLGTIINSIVWENESIQVLNVDPEYSCIQDWTGGGEENISEDPKLLPMGDGTYRLTSDSPCIDAGKRIDDVTTDYQGQLRGFDGTPEFRGTARIMTSARMNIRRSRCWRLTAANGSR